MPTRMRSGGGSGAERALALAGLAATSIATLLVGCGTRELPPYGEALVVVDTNLPVPRVVSRLRIDVYAGDGTWIATRDELRADASDFPTSFSVYTEEGASERDVFVRLRAYPDGRRIRYTGRIAASFDELLRGIPEGDGTPRLFIDGVDRTPAVEPDPIVTVDRLVHLKLVPGERGSVAILLDGACAGVMPTFAPLGSDLEAKSCIGEGGTLAPVGVLPLDPSMTRELPSRIGTFGDEPCTATNLRDETACVPGGTFVFGDRYHRPSDFNGDYRSTNPSPERVVQVSSFLMDVDEVSVGRFRAVLASGFVPPFPLTLRENDNPFDEDGHESCTFSTSPRGREGYPLTCVSWDTAEAFCKFIGGDLPTEVQWEYAAVAAARPRKTTYIWGDEPPSCERAVYSRSTLLGSCPQLGVGPVPRGPTNDITALGLRNLAGNMAEYIKDVLLPFSDDCWRSAPSRDPSCVRPFPPGCPGDTEECVADPTTKRAVRGGDWLSDSQFLVAVDRQGEVGIRHGPPLDARTGFRCVYPAP